MTVYEGLVDFKNYRAEMNAAIVQKPGGSAAQIIKAEGVLDQNQANAMLFILDNSGEEERRKGVSIQDRLDDLYRHSGGYPYDLD